MCFGYKQGAYNVLKRSNSKFEVTALYCCTVCQLSHTPSASHSTAASHFTTEVRQRFESTQDVTKLTQSFLIFVTYYLNFCYCLKTVKAQNNLESSGKSVSSCILSEQRRTARPQCCNAHSLHTKPHGVTLCDIS